MEEEKRLRLNHRHSTALCYAILVILAGAADAAPAGLAGPIKTVVVVVMENRSFDHMLGWMKRLNPEINGVDGTEWNPTSTADPKAARVYFKDKAHYVDPDLGHSFQEIREQIFGSNDTSASPPPMNGFVQQAKSISAKMTEAVMNGFPPEMVAVYQALVSEFAVFDRWFASVPASAQPNRLYVHSATSHGATSNDAESLKQGFPQRTIFENIDDAGLSFGIYHQNIPDLLGYLNLRKAKYSTKFHSYDREFKSHASSGKLPNYVVIEQRHMDSKLKPATDDHPSHDVYQGQMFIKEIYEVLRSSPQWNETLLIITYAEHGGFYDHVPTPVSGVPSPDGIVGHSPYYFAFDRLGVRVPTIMVSPWIQKGTVVHGPNGSPTPTSEYEHSSIPATVKKIFNLPSPYLTQRDAWAGTFEGILQTRKEPRTDCPTQLPTPVKIRKTEAKEDAQLSEFQQELAQLASVLTGDHLLKNFKEAAKKMTVRRGLEYVEGSTRRFLKAGPTADVMGVGDGMNPVPSKPLAVGDGPIVVPLKPLGVGDGPIVVPSKPLAAGDGPAADVMGVGDGMNPVPSKPLAVGDGPIVVPSKPLAVGDGPIVVPSKPLAAGDGPAADVMGVGDGMNPVPSKPLAVGDGPIVVPSKPLAVGDGPATDVMGVGDGMNPVPSKP